jgi:hypothetical protein
MITVLSGLEVAVEVSTLGIGGEEGGVLLGGHIEVLIDLSTLSKFQFQHLLFRSIADAGDAAGVYRHSLQAFLDADEPRKGSGAAASAFKVRGIDSSMQLTGRSANADQHLSQIGFGIEAVEFSRADQAVHRCCAFSASI